MNTARVTHKTDAIPKGCPYKQRRRKATPSNIKNLENTIHKFIKEQDHPCLSAQSVVKNDTLTIGNYKVFGSAEAATAMAKDLQTFLKNRSSINKARLVSFIAIFDTPKVISETVFENLLWKQLQLLHNIDQMQWDSDVSGNPEDARFSFSFGGKAFYIIGMHANSSRMARQFPQPALVFNLHEQFETLREQGHYYKMRNVIRARDRKLQGYENAMVADHGTSSEAKQYSGRTVDEHWKCPFQNKTK